MRINTRTLSAFVVAPIVATAAGYAGFVLFILLDRLSLPSSREIQELAELAFFALLLGLPIAYALTLMFGLPMFLTLRRFNRITAVSTIGSAACIGFLFISTIILQSALNTPPDGVTFSFGNGTCDIIVENVRTFCGYVLWGQQIAYCTAAGAFAGLAFWMIYRGGRPSRV